MYFMFQACFTYAEKGPCYCQLKETAAMKKKYAAQMDQYNQAYKAEDKLNQELETAMRQLKVGCNVGGTKPKQVYLKKTGK